MGVLVKFSYVENAHKYVLGIKGQTFEEELDVLTYYHASGALDNDYYIKGVYDRLGKEIHGDDSDSEIVSVHEIDDTLFCQVSANSIVTPSGLPIGDVVVEAYVHSSDQPSNDGDDNYYQTPAEITRTTDLGKFVMYLKRDLRFVLKVPRLGYKVWFMVPDEDTLDLKDIEGTTLDIHNPF